MGAVMHIVIAFLHHLAAFGLLTALAAELALLQLSFSQEVARKIRAFDAIYGACAGLIVLLGALRVMYFEKAPDYYLHNGPFLLKMTLFALVGLISIYPTVIFLKWGASLKAGALPALSVGQRQTLMRILVLELCGVLGIILAAVMMAKGVHF
jgi:putative membrane protein